MSEQLRNYIAQGGAWVAAIIGTLNFEMWIALAGFSVSAFIAWTNYRSRALQNRLMREVSERNRQIHELEMVRLSHGLPPDPDQSRCADPCAADCSDKGVL